MQLILNLPEDLNYGLQVLNALAGRKEPAKTMTTKTASTVPPAPATTAPEAISVAEATEPTAPAPVKAEDLREKAIVFMKKSDAHKVFMQELVKKYGAKRVSEIPEDKAAAFVNELDNYEG